MPKESYGHKREKLNYISDNLREKLTNLDNSHAIKELPSKKDIEKMDIIPKTQKTLDSWTQAYQLIEEARKIYMEEYMGLEGDNPTPTIEEFRDYLASHMGWKRSERTLRKVIKAGDKGWLSRE